MTASPARRDRRGIRLRARAAAPLLVAAAMLGACAVWEVPVRSHALVHNDTNRGYRIYVPEAVRAKGGAVPLVLVLQGAGSVPDIMDHTHMAEVADREGFAVAFPSPIGTLWNDGALELLAPNVGTDVAFLRRVVDDIDAKVLPVDRRRVYSVGLSNGGMMSLRLACEAADLVAGVAAVAAAMPAALAESCRPSRPVPVLLINGTEDPLVPYRGGAVRFAKVLRVGEVMASEASAALWARLNGCGPAAPPVALPDRDPGDRSRVVRIDYTSCRGARVRLLRVEGGGHTWPSGLQFLPAFMIGPVNRDIDAGHSAWAFFEEAQRR